MKTIVFTIVAVLISGIFSEGHAQRVPGLDYTRIGETEYDLQTNSAMPRRILVYEDGRISVVWTHSAAPRPWSDRGTGYNHFNGTTWMDLSETLSRLEDDRTGWPNIISAFDDDGLHEVIVSHYATVDGALDGGMAFLKNDAIGSRNFAKSDFLTSSANVPDKGPIWPRMAGSQDYIYVIGNYSTTGDGEVYIDGVLNPTVYSKYSISGDSFHHETVLLPEFDSTTYISGRADSYSIDARDNYVSIVIGGIGYNVRLWESDDYGETWNVTVVDSFPHSPFNFSSDVLEEFYSTNDGSVHVVIDEYGRSHVFWGEVAINRPAGTEPGRYFISREYNGLYYWNEDFAEKQLAASVVHRSQSAEPQYLEMRFAYGSNGYVSMPTATIDPDGNIFLVYHSALEGEEVHFGTQYSFSDVYVTASTDNGQTWGTPQNLTNDWENEQAFPSVARYTDGETLHIMYQDGEEPGSSAPENSPVLDILRGIYYVAVPIDDVLNEAYGPGSLVSLDNPAPSVINELNVYPNPVDDVVRVTLTLNKASGVSVDVYNILGQKMHSEKLNRVGPGEKTLEIKTADWKSGIHIVKVTAEGNTQSFRVAKN